MAAMRVLCLIIGRSFKGCTNLNTGDGKPLPACIYISHLIFECTIHVAKLTTRIITV